MVDLSGLPLVYTVPAPGLVSCLLRMKPKTVFIWDEAIVAKIEGDGAVNQLRLKSTKDATISVLPVAEVFIAIGLKPNTG